MTHESGKKKREAKYESSTDDDEEERFKDYVQVPEFTHLSNAALTGQAVWLSYCEAIPFSAPGSDPCGRRPRAYTGAACALELSRQGGGSAALRRQPDCLVPMR